MTGTRLATPTLADDPGGIVCDEELLDRFASTGDEDAFALLIQRHGPMVLGVCRRVLGNHHDAEDAFQATFTVLACKARSILHRERLANWLFGVAQRTALKLRDLRQRREEAEHQAPPRPILPLESAWRDVQQALDEEIGRLDPALRSAIVLCYLEGKTHEDAARELGRPLGSMSWLLNRALAALRRGLANRGLTLTGGMSSLLLALQGPFPVSPDLVVATLRVLGTLGTTSPLAVLVAAVLRDLVPERASTVVRTASLALLVLLAMGAGYKAIASGLSRDAVAASSPIVSSASALGVKKCCGKRSAAAPPAPLATSQPQ